jgi:L-threonylcarbamoyladenylate synthase
MSMIDQAGAIERLRRGELVAIPTETVYGLAGRIDVEDALRAIFATKRRPFFDPLIVHVPNVSGARGLTTRWTDVHDALAAAFWPGPLTLVVPKVDRVSDLITAGLDTVGVRCPNHPLTLEVLEQVGAPLAAPSANMFGKTSPTLAAHVEAEFGGLVPVLDGGACAVGVESTVALVTDREVQILRPGGVSSLDLERALRAANLPRAVVRRASVRSPGHLEAHYQPANPVVAVTSDLDPDTLRSRAIDLIGAPTVRWLDWPSSPALAARTLYADLRRLSTTPAVLLWRPEALEDPQWEAILDRMGRATTATWT